MVSEFLGRQWRCHQHGDPGRKRVSMVGDELSDRCFEACLVMSCYISDPSPRGLNELINLHYFRSIRELPLSDPFKQPQRAPIMAVGPTSLSVIPAKVTSHWTGSASRRSMLIGQT